MIVAHRLFTTFLLVLLVSACASMPTAQSTEQKIAYAQATLTGVVNSAAALTESGRLSKKEAQAALELAEQAEMMITLAKESLGKGDEGAALSNLKLAHSILTELNKYLQRKSP